MNNERWIRLPDWFVVEWLSGVAHLLAALGALNGYGTVVAPLLLAEAGSSLARQVHASAA
jgi:hypothetical protein